MKLKPSAMIRPMSVGLLALLFSLGLNNLAFADNAAALKDSIKTKVDVADAEVAATNDTQLTPSTDEAEFNKLDANQDGKISLKEAVKDKSLTSLFDAADSNHDGMISADEYVSYKSASSVTDTPPVSTSN